MLDTVRLKFKISPSEEQLQYWTHHTTTTQAGAVREKYTYNPELAGGEVRLRCTYFPLDYNSNPMTTLEVSLPKMIHGNNFKMIGSVDGTIKITNLMMELVTHFPNVDIADGELIRLDLCYNHQVGDMVADYINAIGKLDYPHRRTKHHRNEGAEFRSRHVTTKFYDKQQEAGTPDAYGILRQETTILRGKRIKELTGVKHPKLTDITPLFAKEQLEKDLERLKLLDRSIADRDTALKLLSEEYGPDAGIYYFGLMQVKQDKPKRRILAETQMHPRSLDRRLRKITDSGIALILTERSTPLPPLRIENRR
ncbi:MAG: hypothetical protein DWQ07_06380 [Chloroflexi bacterium]|nr:MAG: hypothetical protein DWQ07_06380 [Chloroflexota bacterium]MBL1195944.1 hypothetical protein [Chloroflexota bacterium]NOH13238.1 hypothetical protein [Chloroflexota bacterium]